MSRTVTKIQWNKDICPLYNRTTDGLECETCKFGYLGNYYLKHTICGYDSSEEVSKENG